jgi:hypothetical protein
MAGSATTQTRPWQEQRPVAKCWSQAQQQALREAQMVEVLR